MQVYTMTPQENKRKRGHEHEEVFLSADGRLDDGQCAGRLQAARKRPLLRIPRPLLRTPRLPLRAEATGTGTELKFSTGGDQGTYYGFGSVLAQAITSSGTGTKVTAVTSNGSQDNIEQMDMNTRQLGFVQSDVMSYAYDGTNLFEGMPITNFSTVAALYMEQVQIVTCNPDIKTVADLKGKTVSIGAAGSGVFYNALDILVPTAWTMRLISTPSIRTSATAPTPSGWQD